MLHRRKSSTRTWKAWTLFLLALVAVGAPVWANAYVCPMDRAAKAASTLQQLATDCCPKAHPLPPAPHGVDAWEVPCDCAQLQWNVSDIDQPRTSNLATSVSSDLVVSTPRLRLLRVASVPPSPASHLLSASSPPLWVLNQSILR